MSDPLEDVRLEVQPWRGFVRELRFSQEGGVQWRLAGHKEGDAGVVGRRDGDMGRQMRVYATRPRGQLFLAQHMDHLTWKV